MILRCFLPRFALCLGTIITLNGTDTSQLNNSNRRNDVPSLRSLGLKVVYEQHKHELALLKITLPFDLMIELMHRQAIEPDKQFETLCEMVSYAAQNKYINVCMQAIASLFEKRLQLNFNTTSCFIMNLLQQKFSEKVLGCLFSTIVLKKCTPDLLKVAADAIRTKDNDLLSTIIKHLPILDTEPINFLEMGLLNHQTLLMVAAQCNNLVAATALLNQGSMINTRIAPDAKQHIILTLYRHADLTQDPMPPMQSKSPFANYSALDFAKREEHDSMINFLKEHGAQESVINE